MRVQPVKGQRIEFKEEWFDIHSDEAEALDGLGARDDQRVVLAPVQGQVERAHAERPRRFEQSLVLD